MPYCTYHHLKSCIFKTIEIQDFYLFFLKEDKILNKMNVFLSGLTETVDQER